MSTTARPESWRRRHRIALWVGLAFLVGLLLGVPLRCGDAETHTASSSPSPTEAPEAEIWTCSMHPQIRLPEPGKCPICGMDLVPVGSGGDDKHAAPTQVTLSERARALARIETTPVRRGAAAVELRLLGRLAYDETHVRTITPWTDGRIDRLFVSALGERIKRGQMIASIYSPEIYAAQVDLMQAKEQLERLDKALPIAKKAAGSALEAARTRLSLLGVAPAEVEKMAAGTSPTRHVAVTAHYDGTVVEQLVHEGAYVKAGTPLFRTADLATIWAQLDAYEGDLTHVVVGQAVTLSISSFPGQRFEGKVSFVDPIVDPMTRTAQIRVELDNRDGKLSPGMFADAIVHAPDESELEPPLTIPESAPLFTGKRSVVYVEVPGADAPTYAPRVVHLGPRAAGVYPVLDGLEEGERVVVRGAFTLDADLQIQGGQSMMTQEDDVDRAARRPVRTNATFMKGFARVVSAYLDVSDALASDDLDKTRAALEELGRQAAGFDPRSPDEARAVYRPLGDRVAAEARRGAKQEELAGARRAFVEVSEQMVTAVARFGNPLESDIHLATCPMAQEGKGAGWLQRQAEIRNPYFGSQMLMCGDVEQTVKPSVEGQAPPAEGEDASDEEKGAGHHGH